MKIAISLPIMIVLVFLTGCSRISVDTDYDRETDFTTYKTYRWIEHELYDEDNPVMNDQLIRSHVRSSVDKSLALKGYSKLETGDPDFLVAYYFVTRNRLDVTHYRYYYYPRTSVYKYKEGTLILDLVDREKKQLAWRGWATGALEGRQYAYEDIERSVSAMMKRFPPR